ncbi:MAG TPA: Asp-tRNA(Asn)/Glu-tRNA(Gln) amidotransferase GatCAB subunit B, partial [Acidobacteriota bacterium]|nr:Asp-tRNA(Asn)/Glu-tRNA(Gln) amidotransferase GatCAB subunit B [Acidobacteriota bacterium]
ALDYEIERQIGVVRQGGRIEQETRLWDEASQTTMTMRSKEEAHDYRYFPEPDLLPVVIAEEWRDELRNEIPELPDARRRRFVTQFGLDNESALLLTQSRAFADYFEETVSHCGQPVAISNWMAGDLTRDMKRDNLDISECPVSPENLSELVKLVEDGMISGKIAKDVFSKMYESGDAAGQIVSREGLKQISSADELAEIVTAVLEANPDKVTAYRNGKLGLIGFFVGQVMRETNGQANPKLVNQLLQERLGAE